MSIPWIILLSIVLKVGWKKTRFKNFKGVDRGWCRCHFWTRNHTVSVIPGLKIKWVLSSGPNSSLKKKIYFAFLLEIKIVESGSRVERQRTRGIWFSVRWLSGCHESCWWKLLVKAAVGPLCFSQSTKLSTQSIHEYICRDEQKTAVRAHRLKDYLTKIPDI